ncbi:MAG: hypothetical protein M3177_04365 [Pseudomonadota bacterium]|nr:hypothetical protein [Pseudomonadota bacterium]
MKRYFAAAGALLLGTSTVALAADVKMTNLGATDTKIAADAKLATDLKAAGTTWDKSLLATKADFGTTTDSKLDLTSLDKDLASVAWAETGKFQTASLGADAKTAWVENTSKFQTAAIGGDAKFQADSAGIDGKFQTASVDGGKIGTAGIASDKLQLATVDKPQAGHIGMGGPIEAEAATSASFGPQPATQNYPPCEPGPGDDRCIQLYEEGVREQLASWNRPAGGLLDGQATAMGGPYEPVEGQSLKTASTTETVSSKPIKSATNLAMSNEGASQVSKPVASDTGITGTESSTTATDVGGHSEFSGVGGPVEAQSGYPPCSQPGPGEDRCIQLYEAGVSGSGN